MPLNDFDNPKFIEGPPVEPPTISVIFKINTTPPAGREGQYVQRPETRERLFRATESDAALKVEATESTDSFKVSSPGLLQKGLASERVVAYYVEDPLGRVYRTLDEESSGGT